MCPQALQHRTPLEDLVKETEKILKNYKNITGGPNDVKILTNAELKEVMKEIREMKAEELVKILFKGAEKFTEIAGA